MWTGRSDEAREATERWLAHQGLHGVRVRMRSAGDHRSDVDVKSEWLAAEAVRPSLVFEDRARVVAMWRSHGIICAQVDEGDF